MSIISDRFDSYGEQELTLGPVRIEIWHDEHTESPMEWDSVFTLACNHRRYGVGHKDGLQELDDYLDTLREKAFKAKFPHGQHWADENAPCPHCNLSDEYSTEGCDKCIDGLVENPFYIYSGLDVVDRISQALAMKLDFSECEIHPLYLYDHSGISISMTPFGCRWDSGQVGWIFTNKEKHPEFDETRDKLVSHMNGTVETYNHYLHGSCYGYSIYQQSDDAQESFGGFIGPHDESGLFDDLQQEYDHVMLQYNNAIKQQRQKRFNRLKALIKQHVNLETRAQILCQQL